MSRIFFPLLASVMGAGGAVVPVAFAELPLTELGKLEVTVLREASAASRAARPLVVVNPEQVQQIQPDATAEILAHEINMEASGGSRPGNQTINIRGLEGSRVLQTVDGVRQNFESGHRPTYFLDPVLLKNIEVLKGPSSSLWGSGAVGGVVAQNTVNAGDILLANREMGGLLKQGYHDNGEYTATTVAAGMRSGNMDLLASAYYREGNDITLGNGDDLADSAVRNQGTLLKGELQMGETQSLGFNLRQSESDGNVPSNGAAVPSTSNFLIDREVKNTSTSLDYRIDTASPRVNAQVLLYRNTTEADESRLSDGRADSTELETTGFNANNRSDMAGMEWLYGMDYHRDDFSARRGGTSRPLPPEAISDGLGTFIQIRKALSGSVRAELGLRYDYFETDADNLDDSRDDEAFSKSAALVWQASHWLELAARYDEAFRAPSSEELYTTGTHFCMFPGFCNTFVANPDLDPEKARNKELLARMNWSGLLAADDTLLLKTSIFRNDVDDFIEQFVTDPVFFPVMNPGYTSWRNVDKARLEGFEIQASYQWQELSAKLGYGQTDGNDRKNNDDLYSIPAKKWVADVSYGFVPKRFLAGSRLTVAGRQDDIPDANAADHYDGYHLIDLYARWQPAGKLGESLNVDISINNLTDKHYRVAFQELYEAGRDIRIAATYRF